MTPFEKALHALSLALPELRYQRRLQLEQVLPAGSDVHRVPAADAAALLAGLPVRPPPHKPDGAADYVANLDKAIFACELALAGQEGEAA